MPGALAYVSCSCPPEEDEIVQTVQCDLRSTNNESEYEALLVGLLAARELKVKRLEVRCDSLLIIGQINGDYVAKDTKMSTYFEVVNRLKKSFEYCNIREVPRVQNSQVDALASLGSSLKGSKLTSVPIVHLA